MSFTGQEAYDAIKKLEAAGQLLLQPNPTETVLVGSWDAGSGLFTWAIPTQSWQHNAQPPDDGEPPAINPITHRPYPPPIIHVGPVGEVVVNAIDVKLEFQVTNAVGPLQVWDAGSGKTVSAGPGQSSVTVEVGTWTSTSDAPGFTFREFALLSGSRRHTVEVGVFHVPFPIVGAGAFTLPAIPLTVLYAPLPGPQKKNYAEYIDMSTCSRKVETSFTFGTSVKTATAYTTSDFLTKISDTLAAIAGIAAGVIGLTGGKDTAAKTAQNLGAVISDPLKVIAGLLDTTTDSWANSLTTTTDHALQTTFGQGLDFQTPPGLGPGVGDKFHYLRNVRCAWMIMDGEFMFTVLGADGDRFFTAQTISQDLQALSSPNPPATGPTTNLDATSLQMLVSLNPFIGNSTPVLDGNRFTNPTSTSSDVTGPNPTVSVVHEITSTDTETTNKVNTAVSDYKPGWLDALFGSNLSTENQFTLTYGSVDQTTVDQKQTCTLHYFVGAGDPPFLTGYSYDTWFGTLAFYPLKTGEMLEGS